MPRFTPREAVATFIGEDMADLSDRTYQPGRTGGVPVYSYGEVYVFALPLDKNPPKALHAAFPDCKVEPATGKTAEYIEARGKRVWIITYVDEGD